MAKFDGVSGMGEVKATQQVQGVTGQAPAEKSEAPVVQGGTNFADETKVETTTTDNDKVVAQQLSESLNKDLASINKFISNRNFSNEVWDQFTNVKQSAEDIIAQLSQLPRTPEQETLIKDVRNAIAVFNNAVIRSDLSDDIFYLDNDFYNTSSPVAFLKENLASVRDSIIDELKPENLTDKEKVVYDFLDKAIAAKTEPSKLPGFDRLSLQQQTALLDAYDSSQRDILVDRGDGKKYQKNINRLKNPSLKEKIFWVKNAFDDFALNPTDSNDIQTMVNMAVSEYLYDGKQNNTLTLIRDFDKAWMPSLSDVRHKIFDNPQAILTPREEKVWNDYNHAKYNDPDGGQQGTYEGYLQGLADVIYGGGDFLREENAKAKGKTKKTITRRLD